MECLSTPSALADVGAALINCLGTEHLPSYASACRAGNSFVVALVDPQSGLPQSAAEFKVGRLRGEVALTVSLEQHTARRNAPPSPACVAAMRELLVLVQSEVVQRHLRLGVTALRASRRQGGAAAISAVQQDTRLRTLREVLGAEFDTLRLACAQAGASPGRVAPGARARPETHPEGDRDGG